MVIGSWNLVIDHELLFGLPHYGVHVQVRIISDVETMSHEAAKVFADFSKKYISSQGRFVAALSGGDTPKRFYQILATDKYCTSIEWSKIHFFWVDERCVPKESESSNFRLSFDHLISRISIPDANIHRIKGDFGPEKGAQDYADELKNFFGVGLPIFDLILLGMGEDGHTASLFPGSKSLDEKKRLVISVYAEEMNRITLTLPVLNSARHILFLVSGQSKKQVLNDILVDNERRKNYPAGLVQPVHGDLLWLIDEAAAGKFKRMKS